MWLPDLKLNLITSEAVRLEAGRLLSPTEIADVVDHSVGISMERYGNQRTYFEKPTENYGNSTHTKPENP
jgi:hypothetical protein